MKKLVSIITFAAMLLCFAACGANKPGETAAAAPTETPKAAETAVPAATEAEPTAEPTEEPTPEPTPVPEPVELDFESCAELVARIPWGNGEKEVFRLVPVPNTEDADWVIPEHFNVIDGKVYIFDLFDYYGSGILEYDPGTGELTRISPDVGQYSFMNSEFAILDGKVIFGAYIYDIETGERIELQRIPSSDLRGAGILIMSVRDGKCFAYRAVGYMSESVEDSFFIPGTTAYDEYELDMENLMWVLKRRIRMPEGGIPHSSPEPEEGRQFFCCDRYMGADDAGYHYVDSEECIVTRSEEQEVIETTTWRRITKLAPEGYALSYVDVFFPEDYIHMWIDENYLVFKVDAEGNVWYMCETESEFLIYKITL